jgi:hypothetical protein
MQQKTITLNHITTLLILPGYLREGVPNVTNISCVLHKIQIN